MTNSPKNRDYFITINKDAPCYDDVEEIIKDLNYKMYGLITHDKDVLISTDENGEITETPKRVHKHLMIELKNPISFNSIQSKFKGAHIEVPKYKKSTYQYLIHNSPRSKEKYQYDLKDIITNSPEELKFTIENETFELFKENMFLEYIADGTKTPYQFTKRFGLDAYRQYWRPYSDMLEQLPRDEEMQRDLQDILEQRKREETSENE